MFSTITARLAALLLALLAWPAFAQNLVSDQDPLSTLAEDDVSYWVDNVGAYDGKVDLSVLRTEIQERIHGANLQTGTTYELVLTDAGKVVELTNAAAITLTIPANASVAFPINTVIQIVQGGAGAVTIGITSDTLNGTTAISTQWDSVLLWKRAATEWVSTQGLTTTSATDADAIHDNVAAEISAVTEKVTPVSADLLLIEDSAAGNAKKRIQVGNLPGGGIVATHKNGAYTTPGNEIIFAESDDAAFTVTLPASPTDGDYVAVLDSGFNAATNNITVGRNGNTINGAAADDVLAEDGVAVAYTWNGTDTDWERVYTPGSPAIESAFIFGTLFNPTSGALATTCGAFGIVDCVDLGPTGFEQGHFMLKLPNRYDHGNIRWRVFWTPSNTNTGDARFAVICISLAHGDALAAGGSATFQLQAANGTADDLHVSSWSAWETPSGTPADNEVFACRVQRNGDDAPDTFTGEMGVVGVEFQFGTDAYSDD